MGIYKRMTQKTKKKRKAKQKVEKRRYQRKAFQSARGFIMNMFFNKRRRFLTFMALKEWSLQF